MGKGWGRAASCVLAALVLSWFQVTAAPHAAAGTFQSFTFNGAAGSRPYMVYTPADYTTSERVPLVVMLHGCTQSPNVFANGTQVDPLADQRRVIVAYPQQTNAANSSLCWNWFQPAHQHRDSGEPAIIAGITLEVMGKGASWNVDPDRVYVTGMSAGAAMAVIMGATYPDLYAAMGEHSGLEYAAATDLTSATTAQSNGGPNPQTQGQAGFQAMGSHARMVPVIAFHGTGDFTVRPVNGDQVTQQWMVTDGLASGGSYVASFGSPASTVSGQVPGAQGRAYTVRQWNDAAGAEVQEYWTVAGMGHAWSGGSTAGSFTDPNGPSASQAMIAFFFAHPRGGAVPTPSPTATPVPTPTPTPTAGGTPSPTPGAATTIRLRSIAAEDGSVLQTAADGPPNASLAYVEIGSTALGHGEVAILSFDTSSIPAGATVIGLTLTVTRADAFPSLNDLGPLLVDVGPAAGFNGSVALEQSDYGAPAAAPAGASFAPPAGAGGSTTVSLATGDVSRTGHTQLRLRFQKTTNNDGQLDVVHLASAESGAASAPVLSVTYR